MRGKCSRDLIGSRVSLPSEILDEGDADEILRPLVTFDQQALDERKRTGHKRVVFASLRRDDKTREVAEEDVQEELAVVVRKVLFVGGCELWNGAEKFVRDLRSVRDHRPRSASRSARAAASSFSRIQLSMSARWAS